MNKTTKITLIAIAVIIAVISFRVFAKAEPKQDEKLIIWNEIWKLKLEIDELEKQKQEKMEKKEKLLIDFNTPKWDWKYLWADKWFYPWDTGNRLGLTQ